jgi:hypothetical protein
MRYTVEISKYSWRKNVYEFHGYVVASGLHHYSKRTAYGERTGWKRLRTIHVCSSKTRLDALRTCRGYIKDVKAK